MRIHGSKIIQRRKNIVPQNDYNKYKPELREDFCYVCGYCGKHERVSYTRMEIDHFVPKKVDPDRETDYSNLVYSCFQCNNKKWCHWPTEDKKSHNNELVGFVDPATAEYDNHLKRCIDGTIEPLTDVGKYMFTIFRFDIRVMDVIWKASQLHERLDKLEYNINELANEEKEKLLRDLWELRSLSNLLFNNRE